MSARRFICRGVFVGFVGMRYRIISQAEKMAKPDVGKVESSIALAKPQRCARNLVLVVLTTAGSCLDEGSWSLLGGGRYETGGVNNHILRHPVLRRPQTAALRSKSGIGFRVQ